MMFGDNQQHASHYQLVVPTAPAVLTPPPQSMPTPRKKSAGSLIDGGVQGTPLKLRNRRPIAKLHRNASSSLNLDNLPGMSDLLEDSRLRRYSVNGEGQKYEPPADAVVPPPGEFRIYTYNGGSSEAEDAFDLDTDLENTIGFDGPRSFYTIGSDPTNFIVNEDLPLLAAVLQFRTLEGSSRVKLYIVDLRSAEMAAKAPILINEKPIETLHYVELLNKDSLRIGPSRRDYLFMFPS